MSNWPPKSWHLAAKEADSRALDEIKTAHPDESMNGAIQLWNDKWHVGHTAGVESNGWGYDVEDQSDMWMITPEEFSEAVSRYKNIHRIQRKDRKND